MLVSSHLLSEMALMADDLVVIGRGRLIEQGPVDQFLDRHADPVGARAHADAGAVRRAAAARRARRARRLAPTASTSTSMAIERVGELAAQHGVVLHELSPQPASLEDAFLKATAGEQEYRSGRPSPPPASVQRPRRRRRRAVIDAIRSEWIKVSTITRDVGARRSPPSPSRSSITVLTAIFSRGPVPTAATSPGSSPG